MHSYYENLHGENLEETFRKGWAGFKHVYDVFTPSYKYLKDHGWFKVSNWLIGATYIFRPFIFFPLPLIFFRPKRGRMSLVEHTSYLSHHVLNHQIETLDFLRTLTNYWFDAVLIFFFRDTLSMNTNIEVHVCTLNFMNTST